jgi:release factor glutamine methyltransferase
MTAPPAPRAAEAVAEACAVLAAAGVAEPRREAAALLRVLCGTDARLDPQRPLAPEAACRFRAGVERRARREPFAYVVGWREFWGLPLRVGPGVFVPRPETELLVESALECLPAVGRLCDLCTGSGAVAVAVAATRPDVACDAADVSPTALAYAARNVRTLGLEGRVRLFGGDLFSGLPPARRGAYHVCTCNPPYVDPTEFGGLDPEVRDWEPALALVPPDGWRAMFARLAAGAREWLAPGGRLLCEVGAGQSAEVVAIVRDAGLLPGAVRRDLAGVPRVVEARRP